MLSREVSASHSEVGEGWVCLRSGRKMTTWAAKQRRGLPRGSGAQGESTALSHQGAKQEQFLGAQCSRKQLQ